MDSSPWRRVALESVAREITVGHVSTMASEYVEAGIPFLRSQNVEPLRINRNDIKFITPEFHARLAKSALRPGDVVIVRTGKPGACAVIPADIPESNCSDLVIVRCGQELDPRYLAYYVNTVAYRHVTAHLVGAVQQHFNVGSARSMQIALPGMGEQHAIVAALGALDEKIELHRRMNQTLESMAQTLFQSWFVDFDPVQAHAEGRQPEGMDSETAALFPSRFVESELGKVPEGWAIRQVGDVVSVCGGSTPSTQDPACWEGGTIQWTTPKDLSGLEPHVLLESERRITEQGLAAISSGLLPAGTVLLSSRAPIGYVALTVAPTAVNQGFIAMRCEGPLPNYYMLHWTLANMERIKGRANGTTFPEISKAHFRPMSVVVPTPAVLKAFVSVVEPLYARVIANLKESRLLAELRDTLLPKLLSGELRISESETRWVANG